MDLNLGPAWISTWALTGHEYFVGLSGPRPWSNALVAFNLGPIWALGPKWTLNGPEGPMIWILYGPIWALGPKWALYGF